MRFRGWCPRLTSRSSSAPPREARLPCTSTRATAAIRLLSPCSANNLRQISSTCACRLWTAAIEQVKALRVGRQRRPLLPQREQALICRSIAWVQATSSCEASQGRACTRRDNAPHETAKRGRRLGWSAASRPPRRPDHTQQPWHLVAQPQANLVIVQPRLRLIDHAIAVGSERITRSSDAPRADEASELTRGPPLQAATTALSR